MTDEQWDQIKPFAERLAIARMAYENASIMNQAFEPRAALEQRINFERLMIEWKDAELALLTARRRILENAL